MSNSGVLKNQSLRKAVIGSRFAAAAIFANSFLPFLELDNIEN